MKKTALGLLGAFVLVMVLAAVLLVLAPWIIRQKSVKDRIEAAVSKAVGGPVTYERAGLSLLPRPHLTIRGLRLSIPGAVLGNLGSLDLYAELSPLLAGTVRLTRVVIDHPDITFALTGRAGSPDQPAPPTGRTPERAVAAALGGLALRMPNLEVAIHQGRLAVMENGRPYVGFQDVEAKMVILPIRPDSEEEGAPPGERFRIIGRLQGGVGPGPGLPGPVGFAVGRFEALPRTVSFSDARADLLDAAVEASGRMEDYLTPRYTADLTLNGTVGPDAMKWIGTLSHLPPEWTVRTPAELSKTRFRRAPDGTLRLEGGASVPGGPTLAFDLRRNADRFTVKELRVKDRESQAALTLTLMKNRVDLTFSGHLSQQTLNSLFESERFKFGWVRGDIGARIALDRPLNSTARGSLEGERLVPPVALNIPVTIDRVSLDAVGRTIRLNPLVITLGAKTHTVTGEVTASADEWRIRLKTGGLEWKPLQQLFGPDRKETPDRAEGPPPEPSAPVRATVELDAESFAIGGWVARPARATISLGPGRTRITLHEAEVCGIRLTGAATVQPARLELAVDTAAARKPLAPSLTCLSGKDLQVTGTYDLSGAFTSQGPPGAWLNNLRGTAAFTAENGRILHSTAFVKILGYLNNTELLKGKLPDSEKSALPYQSLTLRGTIQNGAVEINEAVLIGPVLHMTGLGSLRLSDRTMDTAFLVAPFPTADAVVKNIPLVKDILGGTLVTIPLRVKGPFGNPKVTAMAPDQVADELGGLMKRTLQLPFTIIKPILPKKQPKTIPPE